MDASKILYPEDYFERFNRWKFKNTFLLIVGLVLFFYLLNTSQYIQGFIKMMGGLGYFGAFITGIFFVMIYTVAPAGVILIDLANQLNPWIVALFGGLGAVIGDYIVFKYLRDRVFSELLPIAKKVSHPILSLLRTPYFAWIIPIAGAIVIASPVPDEIGVGMLGASKIRTWHFIVLTFILNFVGIFLLVSLTQLK